MSNCKVTRPLGERGNSQASKTYYSNFLSRAGAVLGQGREGRDAATQHWSCDIAWDRIRYLENKMRMTAPVVCIPAKRLASIRPFRVIRAGLFDLAVIFTVVGALLAVWLQTGTRLSTDTDTIAHSDTIFHL